MPGPQLYLYRPLPFHTVGADSISARVPSPLRPTNPRVALLYSLYVRAVRGISHALKTARRAVFAPRYADAGPGLFDSCMGHHLRPTPIEKQIQRKKHYLK